LLQWRGSGRAAHPGSIGAADDGRPEAVFPKEVPVDKKAKNPKKPKQAKTKTAK
jgi:hypothetical protein